MAVNNLPSQPKRTGTGFTNLQRIMQANQGTRLGQTVGSGIQQTGQQAGQRLGEAENQFKTQAEANRLDTDENKQRVQNVLGAPEQASDSDFNAFDKFRAGQYTGPRQIQDIETLKGQAKEAEQLGKSITSAGGRQGLLQRFAAGPGQYTSGQQKLDSLLLGATGGRDLRTARRAVSGLGQQAENKAATAGEIARSYENQARGFGQDVYNQTSGLAGQALSSAEQRAQAAAAADAAMRERADFSRQNAAQNNLTQQALEALGLQAGQRTYGVNLGEFIGYQGRDLLNQPTAEEVMTQPEFQKFSNLRRLMGGSVSEFDPNKVGGYEAGKLSFNKDAAQEALRNAEAKLDPARAGYRAAQEISNWLGGNLPPEKRAEALSDINWQQNSPYGIAQQAGIDPAEIGYTGSMFYTPEQTEQIKQNLINHPRFSNYLGQKMIAKYHPGAVTNGVTRSDWAASNLASALANLNAQDAALGGQVNILNEDPNMENTPKVT